MAPRVIALLTDFGEEDYFVASLKAVVLNVNPEARIVDISHRIPSFDIDAAGFVLFAAYKYFPKNTIFVAIVDPGVGTGRQILLVKTEKYFFIAPDNGLLSLALGEEKVRQVRHITNPAFFLTPASRTFEGRDKMAPVAAWLSKGTRIEAFGPAVKSYKKGKIQRAEMARGEIHGRVLYADKFGNLITNIPAELMNPPAAQKDKEKLVLFVADKKYGGWRENYSEAEKDEVFFLAGSLGLIEISARKQSAALKMGFRPGQEIKIAAARRKR